MKNMLRRRTLVLTAFLVGVATAQSKLTTIYSFQGGTDGAFPAAGLIVDSQGNLYGTTFSGGSVNDGTVFELTPPAQAGGNWTESVLYTFLGSALGDGAQPASRLIFDASGALYGTTSGGGLSGNGTVFKLSPPSQVGGNWTESILYSFQGGTDGTYPSASLIFDSLGNLYGTTFQGGAACFCGTVFELTPPGQASEGWTETILYAFQGNGSGLDGAYPIAPVVMDSSGALYGTTSEGGIGSGARGTVFQLTPPILPANTWTENILHTFHNNDGSGPSGGLTFDKQGALYGSTVAQAAKRANGEVFRLSPPQVQGGAWALAVLHRFGGPDGSQPIGTLLFDKKGNIFGNTFSGGLPCDGRPGCGTVYRLTPPVKEGAQWMPLILHRFMGGNDGAIPEDGLTFGTTQGFFYGVTNTDGALGFGTVFQIQR